MSKELLKNTNHFTVAGYLRELDIKEEVGKRDEKSVNVIRGAVTISTSKESSHKLRVYVTQFAKDGKENKTYLALKGLKSAVSIAAYMTANPNSTYEEASSNAAHVYAIGKLEEYASFNDAGQEVSIPQLRANIVGLSVKPDFTPEATVELGCYVDSEPIPEVKDEEETGRATLKVISVDDYSGKAARFTLVIPDETLTYQENDGTLKSAKFVDYIGAHYEKGVTARFCFNVVNLMKIKEVPATATFGKTTTPKTTTEFVHELVICGGDQITYSEDINGEELAYTKQQIVDALVKRDAAKDEAAKKATEPKPTISNTTANSKNWGFPTTAASAAKPTEPKDSKGAFSF